jgi:hypothetical protein
VSFSFNAVGSRDEVVEQLGHVKEGTHGDGALGPEIAALLAAHLKADDPGELAGSYRVGYVVKASGHSGGGIAASLNVTLEPLYVQWPREAEPETALD